MARQHPENVLYLYPSVRFASAAAALNFSVQARSEYQEGGGCVNHRSTFNEQHVRLKTKTALTYILMNTSSRPLYPSSSLLFHHIHRLPPLPSSHPLLLPHPSVTFIHVIDIAGTSTSTVIVPNADTACRVTFPVALSVTTATPVTAAMPE